MKIEKDITSQTKKILYDLMIVYCLILFLWHGTQENLVRYFRGEAFFSVICVLWMTCLLSYLYVLLTKLFSNENIFANLSLLCWKWSAFKLFLPRIFNAIDASRFTRQPLIAGALNVYFQNTNVCLCVFIRLSSIKCKLWNLCSWITGRAV